MARLPRSSRLAAAVRPWVAALASLGIALALLLGGPLTRWFAAAGGLALVLRFVPAPGVAARQPALARALALARARLPHLVLVIVLVALLGELALGHPPASRDHGIHYFQTHVLAHELLPSGNLRGWSDSFNSGYPYGDSYPLLGYVWVAALHLASFGAISLRASYALGLLSIWLTGVWAIWRTAAMLTEELVAGRGGSLEPTRASPSGGASSTAAAWAGCLAAGLWLLDPGASREGGWTYLMFHGVWPQMLSSALWMASLPLTYGALKRPRPRALALAALAVGGSVLAHPFGLLTAASSLVAWPLVLAATGALRRLPAGALRWLALVYAVAGALALAWVVGFLDASDEMNRSPVPWHTLGELTTSALRGELFDHHGAWVGPLAVAGVVVAARRGGALAWVCVLLLAGMLVLGSESAVTVLRLDLVVSAFKNLQFPRYAIAIKPIWCALAGLGGVALLARPHAAPDPSGANGGALAVTAEPGDGTAALARTTRRRRGGTILLAALAFGPLLAGALTGIDHLAPHPVGAVHSLEGSVHEAHERSLRDALVRERAALGETPLTVAFLRRGMGGGTYPLFAIADAGARVVMDAHVPAINYGHQLKSRTPVALRSLGVTHVLWDRPLGKRDRALAEELVEIDAPAGESFGTYRLARLPAIGEASSPLLRGTGGTALVRERSRERVVLELSELELDRAGTLILALGPYPRWRARDQDGQTLALRSSGAIDGVPATAITLPAGPRTRTITLEYTHPAHERRAPWVSLAALVVCVLACTSGRELELAQRLHAPVVHRLSWAIGALAVVLLVAAWVRRTDRQLAETWSPVIEDLDLDSKDRSSSPRLRRDLAIDGDATVASSNPRACDPLLGRDALEGCSEADARPRLSMVYRRPYLYRCLRVQVPGEGRLSLTFDGLAPDEAAVGFVARLTAGRHGGEGLKFRAGGQRRFTVVDKLQRRLFHSSAEAAAGTLEIELTNDFAWPEDVCVAAAAVR